MNRLLWIIFSHYKPKRKKKAQPEKNYRMADRGALCILATSQHILSLDVLAQFLSAQAKL